MKDIREGDQMRETKNNGHVGGGEKNRKMSVTLQTQIRRCKRIFCARQFVSITSLLMINYNKSNGQRAILEIIHFYSWRGRTKPNLCTLKPNASLCRNVCSGWVFSISLSQSPWPRLDIVVLGGPVRPRSRGVQTLPVTCPSFPQITG